jgi:hypothetical protein
MMLNSGEYSYTFSSLKKTHFSNLCFGTILATDNVIRTERVDGSLLCGSTESWAHNKEHDTMFCTFLNHHVDVYARVLQQQQQQQQQQQGQEQGQGGMVQTRVEDRARQWEQELLARLGSSGEAPNEVFARLAPTLRLLLGIGCAMDEEEEPAHHTSVWSARGDKLTWRFIDMALCWGIAHNISLRAEDPSALSRAGGRGMPGGEETLVGSMIILLEREGHGMNGRLPLLHPSLARG